MSAPSARLALWAPAPRWFLALPLTAMAALLALSSVPGVISPDDPAVYTLFLWVPPTLQNLAHVPAFLVLALLWRHALSAWLAPPAAVLWTLGLCAAFAVLDEWYQTFVPGRYGSATDVLLDFTGALLGVALYAALARRYSPHTPSAVSRSRRPGSGKPCA